MNHPEASAALARESPAAESTAISEARTEATRFSGHVVVGGILTAARARESFDVENPGDGTIIGFAPRCGSDDVEWAVATAHDAFPRWSRTSARARGELLRRVRRRARARKRIARAPALPRDGQRALHAGAPRDRRDGRHAAAVRRPRLGAEGPHAALGGRPALLHDARSARRRRRDHPVERAAVPHCREAGAVARRRQHGRR